MYQGKLIAATTFSTFDTYLIVGIFYLILTMPLSLPDALSREKWVTA